MAKVINLGRVKKQQARSERRQEAGERAVRFGRTKAEKAAEEHAAAKATRHLDGHKRDD